jgi:hypothetical protein
MPDWLFPGLRSHSRLPGSEVERPSCRQNWQVDNLSFSGYDKETADIQMPVLPPTAAYTDGEGERILSLRAVAVADVLAALGNIVK